MITLNTLVKIVSCKNKSSYVILFKVSLQGFNHDVWEKLNGLKLMKNSCN